MRHAHAHAGWADLADAERPLTAEGRARAAAQGEHVRAFAPELVVCSTARRATETLEAMGALPGRHLREPRLYGTDITGVLLLLAELGVDATRVALIGHLPTVADVVTALTGEHPIPFGPGTIVELAIPDVASWDGLGQGSARRVAVRT